MNYLAALLFETLKAMATEACGLLENKLNSVARQKVFDSAPKNPFFFARLLQSTFRKPHDSVQSRSGTLPAKGLAGKTARRILVYHEASVVGPHIEAYIDYEGLAHNIGVKRLTPERLKALNLKKNSKGWLTQDSQDRLAKFWAAEFGLGETRWLPQSSDHRTGGSVDEARMQWANLKDSVKGYGAGDLRMVLSDIPVVIGNSGSSLEFVDPLVDRHRKCFVFKIMDKKEGARPRNILGVGRRENPAPPNVEKLHLKMIQDLDQFTRKVGKDGLTTIKEDGASVKVRISPKGSQFWSPRVSKVTGAQILYDSKVRDWTSVTSPETIEGMGEFLAYRQRPLLSPNIFSAWFINLFPTIVKLPQLSAAEIGGLLNSNEPIPDNIHIELVLYLVSKVGRQDLTNEPYSLNYGRVEKLAALHNDWRPPFKISSERDLYALCSIVEGYVGVPSEQSLSKNGYKFKTRSDTQDGIITKIDFKFGPSGKVAGVIWYKDDRNGRTYKTSSGLTEEMKKKMLENPKEYEGQVMVLDHFAGHPGRAAKVREFSHFHPDKGGAK